MLTTLVDVDVLEIPLSILLTMVGVIYTKKYSSVYHVKKNNTAMEKYVVTEKSILGSKTEYKNSCRISLQKSSVPDAQGFMDVSISEDESYVSLDRYSFIHSCNHALIAPGRILLSNEKKWVERAPSNDFQSYKIMSKEVAEIPLDLLPKNILRKAPRLRCIESLFDYPATYTGPHYKKRLLVFAQGIGIVYGEVEYKSLERDVYKLRKYRVEKKSNRWLPYDTIGSYWIYDVSYNSNSDPTSPRSINMLE